MPTKTSADAISLPMEFDAYRLKFRDPQHFEQFARTDPRQFCINRKTETITLGDGGSRQTEWGDRQIDDALATTVGFAASLVASFRRLPCSCFPLPFVGSCATSIDLVGSGCL